MNEKHRLLPKRTTITILISVLVLIIANLIVSNTLATTGEKVKAYELRKYNLLRQNDKMNQEIIEKKTLSHIKARAEQLGMVKIIETISIDTQLPIAMSNP
jgi:hypothetical protein